MANHKEDTFEKSTLEIIEGLLTGDRGLSGEPLATDDQVPKIMKAIKEGLQEQGRWPLSWTRQKGEYDGDFIERFVSLMGDDVLPKHASSKDYKNDPTLHEHYAIPKGTERIVATPFGHTCPNCGGAEYIVTFLRPGGLQDDNEGFIPSWVPIGSIYTNLG